MISGHVAEALQNTPPDVYVTSDGGYNWIKVNFKNLHLYSCTT